LRKSAEPLFLVGVIYAAAGCWWATLRRISHRGNGG
jgi:hypothetical protein